MPLVDVQTAKLHLRVLHAAEDDKVADLIAAAEAQMQAFLGRNVYATEQALAEARAAAPAKLAAASTAYETATTTIQETTYTNDIERDLTSEDARIAYYDALVDNRRTVRGILMGKNELTALLQIVGHLWTHRGQDEAPGLPPSARDLLWPKRIGVMGLL